jgi:hypothetical protein
MTGTGLAQAGWNQSYTGKAGGGLQKSDITSLSKGFYYFCHISDSPVSEIGQGIEPIGGAKNACGGGTEGTQIIRLCFRIGRPGKANISQELNEERFPSRLICDSSLTDMLLSYSRKIAPHFLKKQFIQIIRYLCFLVTVEVLYPGSTSWTFVSPLPQFRCAT